MSNSLYDLYKEKQTPAAPTENGDGSLYDLYKQKKNGTSNLDNLAAASSQVSNLDASKEASSSDGKTPEIIPSVFDLPNASVAKDDPEKLKQLRSGIEATYNQKISAETHVAGPVIPGVMGTPAVNEKGKQLQKEKSAYLKEIDDYAATLAGSVTPVKTQYLDETGKAHTKVAYVKNPGVKDTPETPFSTKPNVDIEMSKMAEIGKTYLGITNPKAVEQIETGQAPYLKQQAQLIGVYSRSKYLQSEISKTLKDATTDEKTALNNYIQNKATPEEIKLLSTKGVKQLYDEYNGLDKLQDEIVHSNPEIREGTLKKALFNQLTNRFGTNQGGLLMLGTQGWSKEQVNTVVGDFKKTLKDPRDVALLDKIKEDKELGVLHGDNQSWASKVQEQFYSTIFNTAQFVSNIPSDIFSDEKTSKQKQLEALAASDRAKTNVTTDFKPDKKQFFLKQYVDSDPQSPTFLQTKENKGEMDGSFVGKVFYNSAAQFGQFAAQAAMAMAIPEIGAMGFDLAESVAAEKFITSKGADFFARVFAPAYAMTYDNNYKQSFDVVGTKDVWKNKLYATLNAAFEGGTEALGNPLEQTAILKSAFKKGIGDFVRNLSVDELQKMGKTEFRDKLKNVLAETTKSIGRGAVGAGGEANEEFLNDILTGTTQMIFNPAYTTPSNILTQAGQTWLSTFAGMGFLPGAGAVGGIRAGLTSKLSQDAVTLIAQNSKVAKDNVQQLLEDKEITQDEVNEKVRLINTASLAHEQSKKAAAIQYITTGKKIAQSDLLALTMARANELSLDKQIDEAATTGDEALKQVLEGKKKEFVDIRTAIINDKLAFDPVTGTPAVPPVATAKDIQQPVSSVQSAVIEIGGKMYEGKNHAEAILKAKADGQDISNVDRTAGKFKLSDGTIIDRAEAKSRFGQDRSELLIPQDEAAKQADKEYAKVSPTVEPDQRNLQAKAFQDEKEKADTWLENENTKLRALFSTVPFAEFQMEYDKVKNDYLQKIDEAVKIAQNPIQKNQQAADDILANVLKQDADEVLGAALQPKVRVMGEDAVIEKSFTDTDGILHELYKTDEGVGLVRMKDIDSGEVITIKKFPTFKQAEEEYKKNTKFSEPISSQQKPTQNETKITDQTGQETTKPESIGQFPAPQDNAVQPEDRPQGEALIKPQIEQNAETVRGDTQLLPQEGGQAQSVQNQGSENLQLPPEEKPVTAATKQQAQRVKTSLASKIGATVSAGDISKGKRTIIVNDANGNPLRKTSEQEKSDLTGRKKLSERSAEFNKFFEVFRPALEKIVSDRYDTLGTHIDVGMPTKYIRSGVQGINSGKYNVNSYDLLDALERMYDEGFVHFFQEGNGKKQYTSVPIEFYTEVEEDANAAIDELPDEELGDDPMADLENIPASWVEYFADHVTEILGDEWTPADFDQQDFDNIYDEAFNNEQQISEQVPPNAEVAPGGTQENVPRPTESKSQVTPEEQATAINALVDKFNGRFIISPHMKAYRVEDQSTGKIVKTGSLTDAVEIEAEINKFIKKEDKRIAEEEKYDGAKEGEKVAAEKRIKIAENDYNKLQQQLRDAEKAAGGKQLSFDQGTQQDLFGVDAEEITNLRKKVTEAKAELDAANQELENIVSRAQPELFGDIILNPSLSKVAEFLDVPEHSIEASTAYTHLNDFLNHSFDSILKLNPASDFAENFMRILGLEDLTADILEERYYQIFKTPADEQNTEGQGGRDAGPHRPDVTGAAPPVQSELVQTPATEGNADIGTTASGTGLFGQDAVSVESGATGISGEGNSVAGDNAKVRPVNYHRAEDEPEDKTFNKKQRFDDNINALRVLLRLQMEGRNAYPDEQKILAKYVGFGGLKQVRQNPEDDKQWQIESDKPFRKQVREVYDIIKQLDPSETRGYLAAVKESTLNAHYTSFAVIRGIYDILQHAGFTGGNLLEPSAGIGNFFAAMPQVDAKLTGVELDQLTGQILEQLFPQASIHIKGYQNASLPENHYDLAISNVPFGQHKIFDKEFIANKDKRYAVAANKIHNYFFVKTLDLLRPGGVMAFITSRYTMDTTEDKAIRELLADHGEFMGAVRLPDTAFQANAGTEVVTDIIFFRKYNDNEARKTDQPFIKVSQHPVEFEGKTHKVFYNDYFFENPDMAIGTVSLGGLYSGDEYNLTGDKNTDFRKALAERADKIFPTKVFTEQQKQVNEKIKKESNDYVTKEDYDKIGNIVVLPNGEVGTVAAEYYIDPELDNKAREAGINPDHIRGGNTSWYEEEALRNSPFNADMFKARKVIPLRINKKVKDRAGELVRIRSLVNKLFMMELRDYSDDALNIVRSELKDAYNKYVKKYGNLNSADNKTLIQNDTDQFLIYALEKESPPDSKKWVPSDIFSKRTIKAIKKIDKADNLSDAVLVSFEEFGNINMDRIADLLSKNKEDILKEQQASAAPFLFERPEGDVISRDEYLTGNVKEKLAAAKQAAVNDEKFEVNVRELEKVIPADIDPVDIFSPLNAKWIPKNFLEDFFKKEFGLPGIRITYHKADASYEIDVTGSSPETLAYSTQRRTAEWVAKHALNGLEPVVKYTVKDDGTTRTVVDQEDTQLARELYRRLHEAWDNFKYEDFNRREALSKVYNDDYNNTIVREYDGSHLTFPGLLGFKPMEHQKTAAWRFLQTMNGIIDHMVGAGKTLTMAMIAMEAKRLGRASKPLVIGLKSQVPQMVADFKKAYPLARILAPTEKDFTKLTQIATNDWDAVIITHNMFNAITQPADIQIELVQELVTELEDQILRETDKRKLSGLQKRLVNYRVKIQTLLSAAKDTDILDFSQLGADLLLVDESQEYKNLEFLTRKQVKGLGNPTGSKRSFNLLIAARYLQKLHGGDKGLILSSGTPIANTMAEMYLLFKYLRPSKLAQLGLKTFDEWASVFAPAESSLEYYMSRFKEVNRIKEFKNMGELMTMYREMTDVRNTYNLKIDGRPEATHKLVIIPPSENQEYYSDLLIEYVDTKGDKNRHELGLENGYDEDMGFNPSYGLLAVGFAKKLSVDERLIDKALPGNFKIEAAAKVIAEEYHASTKWLGTQLVFCDIGTPKSKNSVVNLYDHLVSEGILQTDLYEIFGEDFLDKERKPTLKDVHQKALETLEITGQELDTIIRDANTADRFNVYDALKSELIKRGIKPEEIDYIHNHEGRTRRQALYQAVNDGKIRVLIGSTPKMGVGVNVQKRVVAGHHLDITWTPAWLDQRNGRFERQGNEVAMEHLGGKVKAFYYATERSLDTYQYELVGIKSNFINQKKHGTTDRTAEDIGDEFDPLQMAAALSGDPIMKERAELKKKVNELEISYKNWQRQRDRAQAEIMSGRRILEVRQEDLLQLEKAKKLLEDNPKYTPSEEDVKDGKTAAKQIQGHVFYVEVGGKKYYEVKQAGKAIIEEAVYRFSKLSKYQSVILGKIMGFNVKLFVNEYGSMLISVETPDGFAIPFSSSRDTMFTLSDDDVAAGTQLKRPLNSLDRMVQLTKESIARAEKNIPKFEEQVKAEFKYADELKQKAERQREVEKIIKARILLEQNRKPEPENDEEGSDFVEDSAVIYGKATTGDIPYKVIHVEGAEKLPEGDYITVERQFQEYKQLDFTGPVKVESMSDVAWLFRNLETQGIEHVFAVFVKEGSYFIQHLTTGTTNHSLVPVSFIVAQASKMNADKVYIVHNHPSGSLAPSRPDEQIMDQLRNTLSGISEVHGIIINLTSGNYSVIFPNDFSIEKHQRPQEEVPVRAYTFSKQVFLNGYEPVQVVNLTQVAAFLSARRFGAGPKPEVLILNNTSNIVAKLSIPYNTIEGNVNDIFRFLMESVVHYGGGRMILYGNREVDTADLKRLQAKIERTGVELLDYIQVKSDYTAESYLDNGLLYDQQNRYNAGDTALHDVVEDSSSKTQQVKNALINKAFLSLWHGDTAESFAEEVLTKFGYGGNAEEKRNVAAAFEDAEILFRDISANADDKNFIADRKKEISFGPLLQTIDDFVAQSKAAPVKDDFLLDFKMSTSDKIAQLQSGKTWFDIYGTEPEGEQNYFVNELSGMIADGDGIVTKAKDYFGDDIMKWAPGLLEYIKDVKWENIAKKTIAIGRVLHHLKTAAAAGDKRGDLKKVEKSALRYWQELMRVGSLTLNSARLLRILRDNDLSDFFSEKILTENIRNTKDDIEKAENDLNITDDIAEAPSTTTEQDVKEAVQNVTEKKETDKKKKAQRAVYAKKAQDKLAEIQNKSDLFSKIKEILNNLKC